MSGNTPRPRPSGARSTGAKKTAATRTGTRSTTAKKTASRPGARAAGGGRGGNGGSRSAKPPLTGRDKLRRWLRYALIAAVAGTLMMVAIFYFAYRATKIPDPNEAFQAQTTKVYYSGGKTEVGRFETQNRESIPLAEIPQVMQDAVVAAEDRTFWTNKGIDPKGILRAAFSNAKGGATQGASTITQQYVKILYLSQERTFKRKIKEAFLSLKIQQQQSKSQILEGYLNTIYFGRGAYGVQAAANAYFGRSAKSLTAPQAAMLAAVLNSPSYLSPDRSEGSRAALLSRYQYVLRSMVEEGNLEQAEVDKYYDKLPDRAKQKTNNRYAGQRGFMLDLVKRELIKLGFDETQIEGGGLRIETTFTAKAMDAARQAVAEQRPKGRSQLHAATASIDVKTGGLLGFYGGQDYLASQLNWAYLGGMPGSTFKMFALAAALKDGFSLKDTFDGNSPYRFPGGLTFSNQGEGNGSDFGSAISLLRATEESVNTAFIDVVQAMENGPKKVVNMAAKLGIPPNTPGLDANAGVALGSATVSPIQMASAYATIASGGVHHDWHVIKSVTKNDGEVLYTAPKTGKRVLNKKIAADVSYALQQVTKVGTGTKARLNDRPIAGKTGTATNDDDDVASSWFVGFTPQVATAVMYVRGKGNEALNDYLVPFYGGTHPALTWKALMTRLMEGVDPKEFPDPANLDGEAPTDGHEPARPTPTPSKTPTPTPTPSTQPSPTLTPTPTPTPTETPTGEPTDSPTCGAILQPPCE